MSAKKIKPFLGALGANQDASAMLKALNIPAGESTAERESIAPVPMVLGTTSPELAQLSPGQPARGLPPGRPGARGDRRGRAPRRPGAGPQG